MSTQKNESLDNITTYDFSEAFICSEVHWDIMIKALDHLEATGYRSVDPEIRRAASSNLELSEVRNFLKDFYLVL